MSGSRIVERSKKYIKDALLEIMYEKEFSRITVNELPNAKPWIPGF